MRRLSMHYAFVCSLLSPTLHAFQQSPTFSAQRQSERITQEWKRQVAARRPPADYWDDDDEDLYPRRQAPPPNMDYRDPEARRPSPRDSSPMDYPKTAKDEYYSYEEEQGGNYWSNPPARYDPVRSPEPRARVPRPDEPPRVRSRPRPPPPDTSRRKSTFRSGTPPPPSIVGDFYNQLFWDGVDDPEVSYSPRDKTMFGGTKGKFNGLAYLLDDRIDFRGPPGKPPPENFRRARQRSNMGEDYYYDGDDMPRRPFNYYEDDEYPPVGRGGNGQGPPYTRTRVEQNLRPPDVWEETPAQQIIRKRRSSGGQSLWQGGDVVNNKPDGITRKSRGPTNGDWAAEKVANWFRDEGDEYYGERPPTRERKSWAPPADVFSTFFRMDKREMSRQAEIYNQNMGIGSNRDKAAKIPKEERRKGFAYRYDADDSDDSDDSLIVDADVIVTDIEDSREDYDKEPKEDANDSKTKEPQEVGAASQVESPSANAENPKEKRPNIPKQEQKQQQSWQKSAEEGSPMQEVDSRAEMKTKVATSRTESSRAADNWEQRALARDRIPPKVPAWGPNGDLGMDAQEKAYLDAVQEVSNAELRLEQRKKQLEEAEESIEILKFDIKREKRRIARNPQDERMMREDIRSMELDLHDAELLKRKAQDRVRLAENRLLGLKDWYGSLLSLYNHSQAKARVNEALLEFHQNEPAARNLNRAMPNQMPNQGDSFGIQRPHLPY